MEGLDFPGATVDEGPPASAEDMGWIWPGKIPHASEQLSPGAATTDCALQLLKHESLESVLHNKRSHCNDKPARCN